jgi:hypothetical protein
MGSWGCRRQLRNVSAEAHNVLGGPVWPQLHYNIFQRAAKISDVSQTRISKREIDVGGIEVYWGEVEIEAVKKNEVRIFFDNQIFFFLVLKKS